MDESKPDVHSTPRAVGTRIRYRKRRFGLWYHGVVSACAMRVSRGSTCSSLAPMMAMLFFLLRWVRLACEVWDVPGQTEPSRETQSCVSYG